MAVWSTFLGLENATPMNSVHSVGSQATPRSGEEAFSHEHKKDNTDPLYVERANTKQGKSTCYFAVLSRRVQARSARNELKRRVVRCLHDPQQIANLISQLTVHFLGFRRRPTTEVHPYFFGGSPLKGAPNLARKRTSEQKPKCIAANNPMAQVYETFCFRNQHWLWDDLGGKGSPSFPMKVAKMCYLYRRTGLRTGFRDERRFHQSPVILSCNMWAPHGGQRLLGHLSPSWSLNGRRLQALYEE